MPSSAFDELKKPPDPFADRPDHWLLPSEAESGRDFLTGAPIDAVLPSTQQARLNRFKAEDLSNRGIPSYTTASGDVAPITDESGASLTAFDSRHNIAYDSKGEPKQISYGETGGPILKDAFAQLPSRTDPTTGFIEKKGLGLYRYEGQDPVIAANNLQKEKDKAISAEATLIGRKLTLDEHDLTAGTKEHKAMTQDLMSQVPSLQELDSAGQPKYAGADMATIKKVIDDHFNAEYASPDANRGSGFFGGGDLSEDAGKLRAGIDQRKAKAYQTAEELFGLKDQLNTLNDAVALGKEDQRVGVETLLAHARGEKGPLDEASPDAQKAAVGLYPPEEDWDRMLGGEPLEPDMIRNGVEKGNIPPSAQPAAIAVSHDAEDAQQKAKALEKTNPTLAEQFKNVAANMLRGLATGVGDILKSATVPPGYEALINPVHAAGVLSTAMESLATGIPQEELRKQTRGLIDDLLDKPTKALVDDRLSDTFGAKAGNFIGGIAPFVATAIATKGKSIATPLMATLFYNSGFQRTYEDAKEHGASEEKAQGAATAVGAINAVLALPLKTVGAAAEAIFGDTAPKVVQRAIQNAYDHGGPAAVGSLLGKLAETIKAGGKGSAALRADAVEGINKVMAEITKPAAQRVLDVGKSVAANAAIGAGVQTASNLVSKTYDPERGTFEGVTEQAIGFGALAGLSKGFEQVAKARKAKQALDLLAKKEGGAGPSGLPAGGEPTKPGPGTPPAPAGKAKTPETAEAKPSDRSVPVEKTEGKPAPVSPRAPETVKPEIVPETSAKGGDIVAAEQAFVERGGHADKLDAQNKLASLRKAFPSPEARIVAINERLSISSTSNEGTKTDIDAAAHQAATSPKNELDEPTPAQKEAGNYQKGHIAVGGLDIAIENPAGSKRKPEFSPLKSHYGYVKGTIGADKDHVDVFVKQGTPENYSGPVYVVNQHNQSGKFDEHKAIIGVSSAADARAEYLSNYEKGWNGGKSVVEFKNPAAFKEWATSGRAEKGAPAIDPRLPGPVGKVAAELHLTYSGKDEAGKWLFQDTSGPRPTSITVTPDTVAKVAADAVRAAAERKRGEGGFSLDEQRIGKLVIGRLSEHKATLKNVGQSHIPSLGKTKSASGIESNENGIVIEPSKVVERMKEQGYTAKEESKIIKRMVDEEVLHMTALKWEQLSPENTDKVKNWGKSPDDLDKFMSQAYKGWENLSDRQKGHEKLRAVLQKRWTGKLTEAAYQVLRDFLKYLRNIFEKLTPGQQQIVTEVESILKGAEQPRAPPAPKPESRVPLLEKPTKAQRRANALGERLTAIEGAKPTDVAVIKTLLGSSSKTALDQAESRITKLENQHAIREPSAAGVLQHPPEGVGEQASGRVQPREQGEKGIAETRPQGEAEQPIVRQPETAASQELIDKGKKAFEGLFAAAPARYESQIATKGAEVSEGDVEELRASNEARLRDKSATDVPPEALGAAEAIAQQPIPKDKRAPMFELIDAMEKEGITTPEKVAGYLEAISGGKARPYSQSLWDMMAAAGAVERGTHDWPSIYAPAQDEKKASSDALAIKPQNAEQLSQAVARQLQKGPLDRRALTELASESGLDPKRIDEAAEIGVVTAARDIAQGVDDLTPEQRFDEMVKLYDRQPNLTAKTSTSKVNQAYSTPAPLAYAASVLADITDKTTVYEPTAGNGILLIGANPKLTLANELDPARAAALKAQGFDPHLEDATKFGPVEAKRFNNDFGQVDRIIANPPFGRIITEDQTTKEWPLVGTDETTHEIDHAIALKALSAMASDGRAVLILGGKNKLLHGDKRADAYLKGDGAKFWKALYEQYRVVDHFTVSGDLYTKQGAGWPVDVVVIAARDKSPIQLPSADAPRILGSWDDLRAELGRTDADRINAGKYDVEADRERVGGIIGAIRGIAATEPAPGPKGNLERPGGEPGSPASRTDLARPDEEQQPALAGGSRAGEISLPGGEGQLGPGAGAREPVERGQLGEFRVPYKPASKLPSFGIYVPTNMETPAREALAALEQKVGSIDDYVREKLGYKKDAPLERYFSAEQMDALALGISAIDDKTAFVLGDQGGVGKGRVAAGMMRYALKQGKLPIFVTKDEKLYAAMLEDLHDIGSDDITPVFTNGPISFEDFSGRKWQQGSMTKVMKEIARTGKLPAGADVLFTTYNQIQSDAPAGFKASKTERYAMKAKHQAPPDGARMEALKKLAPGAVFIADESHLASGDSIRAWRLAPLLAQAHGVYYSSATFAKRPDSMGIYSRTSLSHATQSMEDLVDAMRQGGVPLQQVVSATLATDGLYMRRERDFSHAVFRTHLNLDTQDRDTGLADNYTEGLRLILDISNKMKLAKDQLNRILRREGKNLHVKNAPRIETTNFASKLHNLVSQYMLAIKAEATVRRTVEGVTKGFTNKAGETKPHRVIIVLTNTMEQPILDLDRSHRPLTFNGMLLKYLDSQRVLTSGRGKNAQTTTISNEPDPNFKQYSDRDLERLLIGQVVEGEGEGGETTATVNEPALAELFRRIMAGVFKDVEAKLEVLDLADMPLSPIDHMRRELEKAGVKTAEVTKRGIGIDEEGKIYKINPNSNSKAAHLRYISDFNNGDTEALIINASGSTGVSMHASEKFKNQKPRAEILVQPNLDINEFVQTLYRIDRTGQVEQPYYELLQTAIPAELRPAAILSRKMGSLNANTTSNAQNEISEGNKGVDIFNQYGDEVVFNYLKSDSRFVDMIAMPKIMDGENLMPFADIQALYEQDGQFSAAVTGRVAVLPTVDQDAFWTKVASDYVAFIAYLDELGENELTASAIDLKAETLESKQLTEPTPQQGRPSGFDAASTLEKIRADIGQKPLQAAEVIEMMDKLGADAYELKTDWEKRAATWKTEELARLKEKQLTWDDEKQASYEAKWREQAEEISAALGLIGSGLHIKTEKGMDGYGAITDVKFDDEHPLTPSKQIFVVHVNTTKKTIRVPASQLPSIARYAVGDFADIYEATAERSNQRYMVTGNLLSAYLAIRDSAPTAKIVQYTTDKGDVRQGILMPAKFTPGALAKKRVVESASHMLQLLVAGRSLTNAGSEVTIVKAPTGGFVMRVPSSRTMGGAYWRDSQLAGLMDNGEFAERGGAMIGKFDAARLPKIYNRLLDLQATLFFTEQEAESLGAARPVRAAVAVKDAVTNAAKEAGMTAKESFRLLQHLVSPTTGVAMDAHDQVMRMLATRNQKAYETDRVLEAARQAFEGMPRPEQIAFIDKMKTGEAQASPELQTIADTMRKIDTESWQAAVNAYSALGFKDKEIPLAWLENHYRVLWKKIPGSNDAERSEWIGRARRGLRGSMGQHKQHTLETMSDGLDMGGTPYSYNPVVMFKLAQADLWKLTSTLKTWKWAKDNGFVEFVRGAFPKAPDGMVELDDSIARVYFPASSGEGLIHAGKYFVEEGFGRLLNNYLSKDHIRQVKIGRGLLWLKNATTTLELSLSAFHAVFETGEAIGSSIGHGLNKLVNRGILKGNMSAAASAFKDMTIGAVAAPVTGYTLGREIRKAAADPAAYFKTDDGKKMLKNYPRAREMIDDLFVGGWKPNELEQDWKNNSIRTFFDAISDIKAGASDNYIGAALRAFPAANEFMMKPLFDHWIPNLKLAQFFKEYAEAIEQNERKLKGGVLTRAALARQVWRFVEDRFGEMNFDSLFWNRNFKSAMQLMFRSVTWKLGSVEAFYGAFSGQGKEFKDAFRERRAPELHRNTSWVFGMLLLTATLGYVISKVLGQTEPKNLTDLVFPRIDPKDDKVRVSLPTYFKDAVHLVHSPTNYVLSSMSGWIGRVADLLRNKDYFGVQIRDTDDPVTKQALEVGQYAAQSLLPFSVRGYKNLSAQDVGTLKKLLAALGINPAPRYIGQSAAERRSEEFWRGSMSEAGVKPAAFETKMAKRQLVAKLRHGESVDIGAAIASGTLKPADVKPLYKRAQMGALASQVKGMPLVEAERVYKLATPKERVELAGIMATKRANSAKRNKKMFTGF